jgi:hypothetical protein
MQAYGKTRKRNSNKRVQAPSLMPSFSRRIRAAVARLQDRSGPLDDKCKSRLQQRRPPHSLGGRLLPRRKHPRLLARSEELERAVVRWDQQPERPRVPALRHGFDDKAFGCFAHDVILAIFGANSRLCEQAPGFGTTPSGRDKPPLVRARANALTSRRFFRQRVERCWQDRRRKAGGSLGGSDPARSYFSGELIPKRPACVILSGLLGGPQPGGDVYVDGFSGGTGAARRGRGRRDE